MKFEITNDDKLKIENWLFNEVYPSIIADQKASIENPSPFHLSCWEDGYPYEGAIGGGLIYQFCPTSIGIVTKAIYSTAKQTYELDLTNYKEW